MRYGMCILLASLVALSGCQGPMRNRACPPVAGPGPGVIAGPEMAGVMPQAQTSQVQFLGPEGMQVFWDVSMPGMFDSAPLIVPGHYDFQQGAMYRLKLAGIPSRPGRELFPTIEVAPTNARTQAFLAHNTIPVEFTDNDFDQVFSGNYVTKVIYLPDPEFQGLAMAGVGTLVNTQLEPGVDPITEADNRGAILAVLRMGNKVIDGQMYEGDMAAGGAPASGSSIPSNYISGVTGPAYGAPMTGSTVGLPGPPSIPHGPKASGMIRQRMNGVKAHPSQP